MKKDYSLPQDRPIGPSLIIGTAVRVMIPFVQLFGLYVIAHGHYSPGGGFQGGVALGASFILMAIAFDLKTSLRFFSIRANALMASSGVFLYTGTGVLCALLGGSSSTTARWTPSWRSGRSSGDPWGCSSSSSAWGWRSRASWRRCSGTSPRAGTWKRGSEMDAILTEVIAKYNYWIYVVLMMIGFYAMIGKNNLVKKLLGMNIFQTAIILMFISSGVKKGGLIPVLDKQAALEHGVNSALINNPVPHVLMLTAIVVSVSVTGVALALMQRIHRRYGTLEENEILEKMDR